MTQTRDLYHYGIMGMKWGVRRYQNKDGTLTEAGKKRYGSIERVKNVVDASSNMTKQLQTISNNKSQSRNKKTVDLSSMTDKELRDQINRKLLERQYNNLFTVEDTSVVAKGKEYASETLKVVGSVLAVTSSALGIALSIQKLRG